MEKSEDNLIDWIASRYPKRDLPIGIGDDMAMLPSGAAGVLVTADMLMDGVDFDGVVHTPEQIGRKALAVSLSDCAAMAVRPRWVVVSVALPNKWTMDQARGLYLGMERLAGKYECRIVGGDTNSWRQPLVVDVMVIAEPWESSEGGVIAPVRRSGMRPGDEVWVTGRLGGSLAGHHLSFEPRVGEAKLLAERLGTGLHAMMDLSDGISTDGGRMVKASGCGMELDEGAMGRVISVAAANALDGRSAMDHALNDGEDFELLFAVNAGVVKEAGVEKDVEMTRIGVVVKEQGVWMRRADGTRTIVEPKGWQHFRDA